MDEKELRQRIGDLRNQYNSIENMAYNVEAEIANLLWCVKDHVSLRTMIEISGWSKQTIYNKWTKYEAKMKSR